MNTLSTEAIYEAVLDNGLFAALPTLVADACGARSIWFHWQPADDGIVMMADNGYFPADYMETYATRFAADDPWLKAAHQPGRLNRFWDFGDFVSDDLFENTPIWNEMARTYGDDTFRCMGAVFDTRRGKGAIGMHRGRRQSAFGADTVTHIQSYADDLRRMLTLRAELPVGIDGQGRLHVAADGRLLYADRQAETYLVAGELPVRAGRLVLEGAFADAVVQAVAPNAPKSGAVCLVTMGGWLDIRIAPLRQMGCDPAAILLIAPRVRLSARECDVLRLLAEGLRLDGIAGTLGLARVTVEMHLRNARSKLKAATLPEAVARAIRQRLI